MNYTHAQIDRANAVSLEDFLRTQGETLIKSGREYRWKEHDKINGIAALALAVAKPLVSPDGQAVMFFPAVFPSAFD